jgi:hypothetical protein
MRYCALLALFALPAYAERPTVEPYIDYAHLSSIQLHSDASMDSIKIGFTIAKGKWEIDLAQGVKVVNGTRNPTESATSFAVRVYPWRKK